MKNRDIQAMKNIDVQTVDPSILIDMQDVKIDGRLPKNDRAVDFMRQIKNPYCYKYGKTVVKSVYPKTEVTFEEIFESILINNA
jgi:hypothetical protein